MRRESLLCSFIIIVGVLFGSCDKSQDNSTELCGTVERSSIVINNDQQTPYLTKDNFNFDENNYIISANVEGDITLPDNSVGISKGAFKGNTSIKSLFYDKEILIGSCSFYHSLIERLEITSEDSIIEDSAFQGCNNLEYIKINGTIGMGAFKSCGKLNKIEIMEGVTTLYDGTFDNCHQIDELILPSSMVNLTVNSFSNCTIRKVVGYNDSIAQWFANEIGAEFESLGDLEIN